MAVVVLSLFGILLALVARQRLLNRELARRLDHPWNAQARFDGDSFRALLKRGASPAVRGSTGQTVLVMAILNGDVALVEEALRHGARVNERDTEGLTPLMQAANSEPMVRRLLAAGSDVNARTDEGGSTLSFAIYGGDGASAECLLQAGAEVDERDPDGWTPLMVAAQFLSVECVRVLLRHGADARLRNHDGEIALDCARTSPTFHGPDYDTSGQTPTQRYAEIRTMLLRSAQVAKQQAGRHTRSTAPASH